MPRTPLSEISYISNKQWTLDIHIILTCMYCSTAHPLATFADYEITAFTFDGRQRKFIIGNSKGDVMVCNAITGELMKQSTIAAEDDISIIELMYIPEDYQLIVTTEASIHVFDDDKTTDLAEGRTLPHVRHVMNAHSRSVTCAACSYPLSLVATG
jgi:hypothetical protein